MVSGVRIEVKSDMKYLGLVLDSRWDFREHFRRLVPRLMAAAAALARLLPNLGGPNVGCRRLYLGVVRSMALYGAPVWASALRGATVALLRKPQRVMAIRAIRGYRTISTEAACVLAGSPPWDLEAAALARLYERSRELRSRGDPPTVTERWKSHARRSTVRMWTERLADPTAGRRTVEAVRPVLSSWLDRRHGRLTFRLTQVLSGHGCFGKYLCRIARREPTTECHHCGGGEDTAQHTLEDCPSWAERRRVLRIAIGADLSLPTVAKAMVESEESWTAVLSFCEDVMAQKETAEREREAQANPDPIRRRRTGVRRRAYQALLRPP